MTDLQRYKFRYFFLAFSAAFFVLTLLLLFLVTMAPPSPRGIPAEAEWGEYRLESAYQPSQEETLNVLLIGSSPDKQEAEIFLLVRFDPVRRSIPILSLPAHTAVQNAGAMESLEQVYRYGGAEYTKKALERTVGVAIDRTVRMDEAAFIACANAVGTVEYVLDREIVVESGGARLAMEPGTQLLDGRRVAALITSPAYAGNVEKSELLGSLAAAIVNQRIDIWESALLDKVFSVVINAIDSDITNMDFQRRKQAGEYLAGLEEPPGIALSLIGREEGGLYHLGDTFLALLRQTFS